MSVSSEETNETSGISGAVANVLHAVNDKMTHNVKKAALVLLIFYPQFLSIVDDAVLVYRTVTPLRDLLQGAIKTDVLYSGRMVCLKLK